MFYWWLKLSQLGRNVMPYSLQSKHCLNQHWELSLMRRAIALPTACRARFVGICLALLVLLCPWAHASPPPETVAEGFGVPSAVAEEAPDTKLTTAQKIEALLAETPDTHDYQTTQRCLSRSKIKRYEVLDSTLLLIHGRKDKVWINQFPRKCVGLRRNMPLILKVYGSQVCANDSFYARRSWERLDNIGARGANLGSVHCLFAPFEAVSVEQAELIKQAAKNGAFR